MSDNLKQTVYVKVEYFDGQEERDVGHPYYVASSDDLHFVTDGETFEELIANIRECLDLTLKDTNSIVEYNVAADAKVQLVMDFPEYA
jgi:predicted RNase H-like HicB family nuclease